MDHASDAEFAPYRFVRAASGEPVELPAGGPDATTRLVLDGERWGLARLHRLAEAARREGAPEAFEEEMRYRSECGAGLVNSVLAWGRRGEELFYVDAMRDGEPLPAYLARVGGVSLPVASRWILGLIGCFDEAAPPPRLARSLSTAGFEAVRGRRGRVDLVLSGFCGGQRCAAPGEEGGLERSLAGLFLDLVGGEAGLGSLPSAIGDAVLGLLSGEGGGPTALREAMALGGGTGEESVPLPRMPWREWLRRELESAGSPEHRLPEWPAPDDDPYAISATVRGRATHLHPLPGPASLPRGGWLEQHHDATRRPGRSGVSQLPVTWIEDLPAITLVGEARVEGVDLAALLERLGPLDLETTALLGERIDSALAALEGRAGACPVWWLPPENVLLLTGSRSLSESAEWFGRQGRGAWSGAPLKLRLHQTSSSLVDGIGLPAKLRGLLAGEASEALRRWVLALPLLWQMLSGRRFRWEQAIQQDRLPAAVLARFEACRRTLLEVPETVVGNLFRDFARWPLAETAVLAGAEASGAEEGDGPAAGEASGAAVAVEAAGIAAPRAEASAREAAVRETAGETPEDEAKGRPPTPHGGRAVAERLAFGGEGSRRGDSPFPWLWIGVAAAVLAAMTGHALSGWSEDLGPFRPADGPAFVLPAPESASPAPGEPAKALGDYLLAEGSVRSLRLLPKLEDLDHAVARGDFESWLGRLSSEGDPVAARVMGVLALAFGEANGRPAEAWFREAARRGDSDSCHRLAALVWDVRRGSPSDPEAVELLRQAAASGHPASRELLAQHLIAEGDPVAAFETMGRAAAQGRASAVHRLGVLQAGGLGCPADPTHAAAQFRRAAELGDERAMHDYALCLAGGFGLPAHFPEALRWMRLASARGHVPAQRWLRGRGLL